MLNETSRQTIRTAISDFELVSPLDGMCILVVMGGYTGKLPLYERAHELGARLVVLDGPGHWAEAYIGDLFEDFIEVDLTERDGLVSDILAAIAARGWQFDAVATFWEFSTTLTARLAEALNLPGHGIPATLTARDKYQMRETCLAAGIPQPRFARIRSAADLEAAAAIVGFPAVLKPVSGAASCDAHRVDNELALQLRYQRIMAVRRSTIQTQDLNSDAAHVLDLIWRGGFDMILEAYLDGNEFDVDCLLSGGEMVFFSVTGEDPQPHMIETGASLPARYPADKQAELVAMTRDVLETLGFMDGVFHVELKYTTEGPRLLEVNARIGGGPVYRLIKWVWGVDLVEQYLLTCLGLPVRPHKPEKPLCHYALRDLIAPCSGIITRDDFLAHLQYDPRVALAISFVTAGQRVTGPRQGVPDCLGEIIVAGRTAEQAYQTLEAIVSQIDLPIERIS